MQLCPVWGQPFDRLKLGAVRLYGEYQTRADWFAIPEDGAGTAYAMLTTEMRPR